MTTEDLIKEHIPLIKHIAKNFYGISKEDLMQAGTIGVLKALKNYKQGSSKFSTYAYDYIFGEMYDFVMKNRKIKINKETLKLAKKIEIAREKLSLKMNKIPTYEEIATFLNIDYHDIMSAILATKEVISLDSSLEDGNDYYERTEVPERVELLDRIALQNSIEKLSPMEEQIIKCRYYYDYTQSETANILGITQVMVSRYEHKSLKRLKNELEV